MTPPSPQGKDDPLACEMPALKVPKTKHDLRGKENAAEVPVVAKKEAAEPAPAAIPSDMESPTQVAQTRDKRTRRKTLGVQKFGEWFDGDIDVISHRPWTATRRH